MILAGTDETPGGPIRFAEYELRKVLGRGGMGVVHQAFHTKLKRLVAVKMLSKEQFDNPSSVARFEQEMAAIGRLSHPNIVVAYDAGEFSGTHYLAMEFVEGMNMAEVAERLGALADRRRLRDRPPSRARSAIRSRTRAGASRRQAFEPNADAGRRRQAARLGIGPTEKRRGREKGAG